MAVVLTDQSVAEGIQAIGPPFPAPLEQPGEADLQKAGRAEGQASTDQFGVGDGAVLLELADEGLEVPGADPVEPGRAWRVLGLAAEPKARYRAGIIR